MSVLNGPVNGPASGSLLTQGHTPHGIQGKSDYSTSPQSSYLNRSHNPAFISSLLPNNDSARTPSTANYDRSTLAEFGFGGSTGSLNSTSAGASSTSPTAAILQAAKLRGLQHQHQLQHQLSEGGGAGGPQLNNENEFPLLGGVHHGSAAAAAARSNAGGNSNHYGGGSAEGAVLGMPPHHNTNLAMSAPASGARSPYANLMKTSEMGGSTLGGGGQTLGNYSKEFRIQNEDFPALPGSETSAGAAAAGGNGGGGFSLQTQQAALSQQQYQQQGVAFPGSSGASIDGTSTRGAAADLPRILDGNMTRGIQTHPDGVVTEIPGQMLADQFGMVGLLSSLRAIYSDQRVVSLTLGQDMTTLGLDLNSPDKTLYQNFGGPWSDAPLRTQDLEWTQVPQEYQVGAVLKEKLAGVKLNRCPEDTLFYLFYQSTQEVYQMAAAAELYSRDWRYHKYEKVWLTRSVRQATEQGRDFERGYYFVFDPYEWRKVQKEMKLEYLMLEERPKFPHGGGGGGTGGAGGAVPPSGGLPPSSSSTNPTTTAGASLPPQPSATTTTTSSSS